MVRTPSFEHAKKTKVNKTFVVKLCKNHPLKLINNN